MIHNNLPFDLAELSLNLPNRREFGIIFDTLIAWGAVNSDELKKQCTDENVTLETILNEKIRRLEKIFDIKLE